MTVTLRTPGYRAPRLVLCVMVMSMMSLTGFVADAAPSWERQLPVTDWHARTDSRMTKRGERLVITAPNKVSLKLTTRNLRGLKLALRASGHRSHTTVTLDGRTLREFRLLRRRHLFETSVDKPAGDHRLTLRVHRVRVRRGRQHGSARVALLRAGIQEWVPIGAAVDTRQLGDSAFRTLVANNFDFVVPENDMKMQYLQPKQGEFEFTRPHRLFDFAGSNGLDMGMAHVLTWHVQNPGWLWLRDPSNSWRDMPGFPDVEPWTRAELIDVLREHITTVMRHCGGQVKEWDVVNEAFTESGKYRRNIWYQVIGPEYIELAFRFAHQAAPEAKLFYNDYGTETVGSRHTEAVYELMTRLIANDVPIDGVGFQFHLFPRDASDVLSSEAIEENFRRFADLGLRLQITELDVSVPRPLRGTAQENEWQADVYRNVAQAAQRQPAVERFTMWGATDRYSWLSRGSNGLPFDAQLKPKPAWEAITEVLRPSLRVP